MNSAARYFSNIGKGFWTVLIGMKVTMTHLFTPAVTIQYPDARMAIPERGRNRLYVNMDDCIGCDQCAMACPVNCIAIETAKSLPTEDLGTTSTGQKKRLWVTQFDIDFGKCCYCGLCVPPCPTECIYMTNVFEFSGYDRKSLIYNFITLTPDEVSQKVKQAQEAEREAAAKKAAAAAVAAAQKAAQAAQKPAAAQQIPPAGQAIQATEAQSPGSSQPTTDMPLAQTPPSAADNANNQNESKPN
ncbi:MAG: NuoI/complex I 23 kDa subunit family protein [Candidatus Kryptoniota bacterium]